MPGGRSTQQERERDPQRRRDVYVVDEAWYRSIAISVTAPARTPAGP
ncbi:hypothetical protein BN2537_893 [Streptomyces venezuelae]|nr:hypothetical protein BN2537_893 [Streptomyces venezuelae]